jgi:hypothetical protein
LVIGTESPIFRLLLEKCCAEADRAVSAAGLVPAIVMRPAERAFVRSAIRRHFKKRWAIAYDGFAEERRPAACAARVRLPE